MHRSLIHGLQMKFRPSRLVPPLVILVVSVLVFEETLYAWLGLGPTAYLAAKVWTELSLYALLFVVLAYRLYECDVRDIRLSKFDVVLLTFIALGVVSTVLNDGALLAGALNIRTMLRYVAAYYIVVLTYTPALNPLIKKLPSVIIAIALAQSALAVIQHFAGDAFTLRFFAPIDLGGENMGLVKLPAGGSYKLGAAIGTFGKPSTMGFFLLIGAIFAYTFALVREGKARYKYVFAYACIVVGILFTYKRGSLLLALAVPVLIPWLAGYRRVVIKSVTAVCAVLVLVAASFVLSGSVIELKKSREVRVSPLYSLMMLVTSDYWSVSTQKSRGWVLVEVGGQAVSSLKPLGYGADVTNAQTQLSKLGGEFSKLVGWGALDDVYVVATLVYFGPVGLTLVILCFVFVYRRARRLSLHDDPDLRTLGLALCAILLCTLLGSFLERTLELRAFAFTLWTLAGCAVAAYRYEAASLPAHKGSNSTRQERQKSSARHSGASGMDAENGLGHARN